QLRYRPPALGDHDLPTGLDLVEERREVLSGLANIYSTHALSVVHAVQDVNSDAFILVSLQRYSIFSSSCPVARGSWSSSPSSSCCRPPPCSPPPARCRTSRRGWRRPPSCASWTATRSSCTWLTGGARACG